MKKKQCMVSPTSFLQKTYDILENESLQSIVSWSAEGTEFVIYSTNEFSEKVLPTYFKHSNYASFIRQLNMYDFHKLRSNNQESIYKHPLFIRGRPDLLKEIHRKTSESNWPVIPKNSISKSNMSPFLNKLYQIHKKNVNYEEKILSLEDKVNYLSKQNKMLADQLWENKNLEKKIEKALIFFARFFKNDPKQSEFPMNFPVFDNILSITQTPDENIFKKQKIDEELSVPASPLSISLFEDEHQLIANENHDVVVNNNSFYDIDRNSEVSLDSEKIDFLLN